MAFASTGGPLVRMLCAASSRRAGEGRNVDAALLPYCTLLADASPPACLAGEGAPLTVLFNRLSCEPCCAGEGV